MPQLRVLIVDDDPVIQLLLRVNMEMEGAEVSVAGDGEAALAALEMSVPDIVLLDFAMPKLDGFGVLEAMRSDERFASVPVILLSAKTGEEIRGAAIDAGADVFMTKPFDPPRLLDNVKTLLAGAS